MDWDHIRIFLEVARNGQILGAARRLGLNHATVGRQLTLLEEELGARLVERQTTGSTLTPAGQALLAAAERAESEFLRVGSHLAGTDEALSGTVRVGAPDGLGNYVLARELGMLASTHPDLVVQLVPLPRTFSLSRREADIVITLDRPRQNRLLVKRLTHYSLSVYASDECLRRSGDINHEDDLIKHVLITNVDDFVYSPALDYTAALRRRMTRRFECGSVVGQVKAVRAGCGISVLHDYVARRYPELRRVLPQIRFQRSYWMLLHPDTQATGRIRAVADHITARMRVMSDEFVLPDG